MAETLTFEDTTEATSLESLTPDEQESLQLGEQMQEAEDTRLAGKYENAQELEKAYIELEKKLGQKSEPEPEETVEETTSSNPLTTDGAKKEQETTEDKGAEVTDSTVLEDLWTEATSKEGRYKKETVEALEKMDVKEIARLHLEYRAANSNKDLSETDVEQLQGIVGGKENYTNMMDWAVQNLGEKEVNMFDTVMERGDPLAAFFAVRSLAYRYNDATGYDGKMVTGKASKTNADVFKSQAEVVAAMGDSKYERDPAYRRAIMEKLDRSDINF
tara:strand:- start:284 stop:1105 length:822 start_codon:yes stop_codon:yes gene_type:complete